MSYKNLETVTKTMSFKKGRQRSTSSSASNPGEPQLIANKERGRSVGPQEQRDRAPSLSQSMAVVRTNVPWKHPHPEAGSTEDQRWVTSLSLKLGKPFFVRHLASAVAWVDSFDDKDLKNIKQAGNGARQALASHGRWQVKQKRNSTIEAERNSMIEAEVFLSAYGELFRDKNRGQSCRLMPNYLFFIVEITTTVLKSILIIAITVPEAQGGLVVTIEFFSVLASIIQRPFADQLLNLDVTISKLVSLVSLFALNGGEQTGNGTAQAVMVAKQFALYWLVISQLVRKLIPVYTRFYYFPTGLSGVTQENPTTTTTIITMYPVLESLGMRCKHASRLQLASRPEPLEVDRGRFTLGYLEYELTGVGLHVDHWCCRRCRQAIMCRSDGTRNTGDCQ